MDDKEMLNFIYQNADMGVDGILKVLKTAEGDPLRGALQSQLSEYDSIRSQAIRMLKDKGGQPEEPSAMSRLSARMTAVAETMMDSSPSHIAEMMIQGNAMGLTKITKRLGEYDGDDKAVSKLAGKLLSTEQNNIEQMKPFLS
jgi:hypothetical protein